MTLHKYPEVLAGDRKSATAPLEGATPAFVAALPSRQLPDRLRGRLGPALASQVDALPVDGCIDRRETIRRFIGLDCWAGRLRPSTTRIRTQVALMAIESRDCGHPNGPFLLNETQLAKDCGYSRQTVWDALRPLKSPSYKGTPKLVRWQSPMKCWGSWPSLAPAPGTGNRRPGFWALRPDLWLYEEAHGYGISAVSVNSHRDKRQKTTAKGKGTEGDRETLCAGVGPRRELYAVPSETTHAERLTRWLSNANLDRLPTAGEKRKLSHATRLLASASVEGVADALLSALWWRTHAPLRLWRDAIDALQTEAPGSDAGDLMRWAHALLKRLSGPSVKPQAPEGLAARALAEIERRIAGADRKLAAMGEVEGDGVYCLCCGKPVQWGPPPDFAQWYRQLPDFFDLLRIPPETQFLYDDYDIHWKKLSRPVLVRASTTRSPQPASWLERQALEIEAESKAPATECRGPHKCFSLLYVRRHFHLRNERARLQRVIAGPVPPPAKVEARVHRREVEGPLSPDGLAVLSFIRGYRPKHVPVKAIEAGVALGEGVTLYGRDGVLSDLHKRGLIEGFGLQGDRKAYITAAGREALPPDPKREANREARRERIARAREQAHRQAVEAACT